MSNPIYLYNTLSRKKEEFKPIKSNQVGLYTCGPTVYNYAHIGNLRTYIFEDILKRVLKYNDYQVKHIMNVTDVGHLTGDRDMGEDKMEKSAKKEGKSAWDIAEFYFKTFKEDMKKLNIIEPNEWHKVTDNIPAQIKLIKKLEENGYTYKINDGIYFHTSKFKNYTKLSHQKLDDLKEGARVEKNDEKKNPTDFALWKFSPKNEKRQMEWKSPWGIGFPGWHIECSAIAMKYLPNNQDIHCGGIDHINIHHTNEIAQSEAATGKQFFNYWMHGAFLNIKGGKKMAKSEENFLTLKNALIKKEINPLAYRYACLQTHYRKPMEYSEESIKSVENALNNLYGEIRELVPSTRERIGKFGNEIDKSYQQKFTKLINDDLNMPQALALAYDLLKSNLSPEIKKATILDFNKVLGLDLDKIKKEEIKIPDQIKKLAEQRHQARQQKNWFEADELRDEIEKLGFFVNDEGDQFEIKPLQ